MLMLTIAIISLIGWIVQLVHDLLDPDTLRNSGMILGSIVVISWWEICFPLAVSMIVIVAIFAIMRVYAILDN